jgi:hypothetical protein
MVSSTVAMLLVGDVWERWDRLKLFHGMVKLRGLPLSLLGEAVVLTVCFVSGLSITSSKVQLDVWAAVRNRRPTDRSSTPTTKALIR